MTLAGDVSAIDLAAVGSMAGQSMRLLAVLAIAAVAYASRRGFNAMRGWVLSRIDGIKKAFGMLILAGLRRAR